MHGERVVHGWKQRGAKQLRRMQRFASKGGAEASVQALMVPCHKQRRGQWQKHPRAAWPASNGGSIKEGRREHPGATCLPRALGAICAPCGR